MAYNPVPQEEKDRIRWNGYLARAIQLATASHDLAEDKQGKLYILHPLRVMLNVKHGIKCQVVAILHDLIEDVEYIDEQFLYRHGFPDEVLDAMNAISRRPEEEYKDYIMRVGENRIATYVKLADLEDNTSESRGSILTDSQKKRYEDAWQYLNERADWWWNH